LATWTKSRIAGQAAFILAAASGFKSANFEANSHENQQNGVKITVFVAI